MTAVRETGRVLLALALLATLVPDASADDAEDADDPVRSARFAKLTERVARYEFRAPGGDEPFERLPDPVLRWTNPLRETNDGGVFLWTDRGRAAAILCAFWRDETVYKHEFQSLSDGTFTGKLEDVSVWSPESGGVTTTVLEKPAVAGSRRLRLLQMREIARRYEGRLGGDGEGELLRLLRQPLYRYPENVEGVVDGALFAFVQTTDPEVLLRIEATETESGERRWTIGFARMSKFPQSVVLEGNLVWSCPWTNGSVDAPYNVLTVTVTGDE